MIDLKMHSQLLYSVYLCIFALNNLLMTDVVDVQFSKIDKNGNKKIRFRCFGKYVMWQSIDGNYLRLIFCVLICQFWAYIFVCLAD